MGLAQYAIIPVRDQWGVLHDGDVNGEYATKEAAFEAALNDAISAAPAYRGLVYRLIDLPESVIDGYRAAALAGETKVEWGFTSTSKVLFPDLPAFGAKQVEIVLDVTQGADIETIAYHGPNYRGPDENQREVLLPSRLRVKVISVEPSPDSSRTQIVLRQAP